MTDQELLKELRRAKAEGATHYYYVLKADYANGVVLRGKQYRLLTGKRWYHSGLCAGEHSCDCPIDTVIAEVEARIAAAQIPLDKRGGGR
jgi:hypothetical protein